ncbi:hypothetical protein MMPV_000410 [Pyropia vietnamensis]
MRPPTPTTAAPPSHWSPPRLPPAGWRRCLAHAAALPSLDALYGALPATAAAAASHRAAVVEWRAATIAAAAASAARRRWRWRGRPSPDGETLPSRAADVLVATGVVGSKALRPPPHAPLPPLPPRGLALVGGVGVGKTLLMDVFVAAAGGLAPGVRIRRLHTAELLTGVYARLRWWNASCDGDRAAAGVGSPTVAAAAVSLWGEEGRRDDGGGGCPMGERCSSGGGWVYGCFPADAVGRGVPGWPEGLADGWTGGTGGTGGGTGGDLPPAAARGLCVDELAVPDVGTRVILSGVLRSLVGDGVVLVFTANQGVAEMDRKSSHCGNNALAVAVPPPRPVRAARFTFEDLCGTALGPADYTALASHLDMLFLTGVPRLSTAVGLRDSARRLITAVDALAEARVLLVVSAEAPLEDLWEPQPSTAAGSATAATATSTTPATTAASTTTTAATEAALDLADATEFETEGTRRGVSAANRGGSLYSGEDVAYAWARAASRLRAEAALSGRLAGVTDVHPAVAATRAGGGMGATPQPGGGVGRGATRLGRGPCVPALIQPPTVLLMPLSWGTKQKVVLPPQIVGGSTTAPGGVC